MTQQEVEVLLGRLTAACQAIVGDSNIALLLILSVPGASWTAHTSNMSSEEDEEALARFWLSPTHGREVLG